MRRMEDEMQNFRTQLIQRQENFFSNKTRWVTSLKARVGFHGNANVANISITITTLKQTAFSTLPLQRNSINHTYNHHDNQKKTLTTKILLSNQLQSSQGNVLEGLSSPLIQGDDGGDKTLKLRFDVSQYAPEEIVLKTIDNKLLVRLLFGWYGY